MTTLLDELAIAQAEIEDAEAAFREAVCAAYHALGTPDVARALTIVHKCQRERERANARFVALHLSRNLVLTS